MTIAEALASAAAQGLARSDALALLCHVSARNRAYVLAHTEALLTPAQATQALTLFARRANAEPLAYLTRQREFYGRMFACTPAALVPRPETELLLELALQYGDALNRPSLSVLDAGTGTGCIAISMACERQHWRVTGSDVSPEALALARSNAQALAPTLPIAWALSDWFAGLATARFDLIVSNPPYISADDPHLLGDGVRWEPALALTDQADGLKAYRHFAQHAPTHLAPRGWLLMEHGFAQGAAIRALLGATGAWREIETVRDLSGHERVTLARL